MWLLTLFRGGMDSRGRTLMVETWVTLLLSLAADPNCWFNYYRNWLTLQESNSVPKFGTQMTGQSQRQSQAQVCGGARNFSLCRGLLKWPFFFLLPLDLSSNTNGSLGTFGRLKEYAFHQGSIMVLLSWCEGWRYEERGQGGQLARDSAGIVNKQVKVNRLEPRNALSSLAVTCPPGIWGSGQDYWSLGFLSPS